MMRGKKEGGREGREGEVRPKRRDRRGKETWEEISFLGEETRERRG